MHLHSRKPSAHRAGSSDVAREVTASVPARVDAPALEKTIRPPRSQLRRRCYLPGARWAPARPIQISSAGASTLAFLAAPVRCVNTTPPSRPAAVASWKSHPISTSGGSTPASLVAADRWSIRTQPSPPCAVGSCQTHPISSRGGSTLAYAPPGLGEGPACRSAAPGRYPPQLVEGRALRGALVSVRDRGGDPTNAGMPGVVANQD